MQISTLCINYTEPCSPLPLPRHPRPLLRHAGLGPQRCEAEGCNRMQLQKHTRLLPGAVLLFLFVGWCTFAAFCAEVRPLWKAARCLLWRHHEAVCGTSSVLFTEPCYHPGELVSMRGSNSLAERCADEAQSKWYSSKRIKSSSVIPKHLKPHVFQLNTSIPDNAQRSSLTQDPGLKTPVSFFLPHPESSDLTGN